LGGFIGRGESVAFLTLLSEVPMKWFVLLNRGESAATAKPVIAISDEHVVRDVLRSVGKHLGITSTPLRSVADRSPDKPEGGER
jgi:hypothetical protein